MQIDCSVLNCTWHTVSTLSSIYSSQCTVIKINMKPFQLLLIATYHFVVNVSLWNFNL